MKLGISIAACLVFISYLTQAFLTTAPVRAAHTLHAVDVTQVAKVAAVPTAPVRAAHTILHAVDVTQVAEVAAVAGGLYVVRGAIGLMVSVTKLADFRTPRGHDTDLTKLKSYGLKVT